MATTPSRAHIAREILANPEQYMVCVGCRSILCRKLVSTCPVCHAYGFDYRDAAVITVANEIGSRPDTTLPLS